MLSSPGAGRTGCFQMSPCRSLVVNRAAPGRVSWPAECTNPHGCGMSVDEEVVGPAGLEADLSPLLLDLLGQAPGDQHGKLPARPQHSANAAERLRNYRLRRGIVLIELAPRRVCQHHINSVIGDRGKPTRILGQLSYARSACQPGQQLSGPVRIAKIRADCFLERLPYPRRDERARCQRTGRERRRSDRNAPCSRPTRRCQGQGHPWAALYAEDVRSARRREPRSAPGGLSSSTHPHRHEA